MIIKFPVFLLLFTFFLGQPSRAQVLLSEQQLINMAKKENPTSQLIEAQKQSSSAMSSLTQDRFNPKFSASYSYASSKEEPIIQFFPVYHPQKKIQIGLQQQVSLGMKASVGLFAQQLNTTSGLINDATQVGAQLGLEIDLWKNFLGRLDRAELQSKELNKEVAHLQSQVDQHAFLTNIRKIYWAAVANELSLDLSQQLVQSAKKQFTDSQRRAREGAADHGDVSRNQAQVQSRQSAVLVFTYQREVYLSQLKSLIPDLANKEVKISLASHRQTEEQTRLCIAEISRETKLNKNYTQYSKIIALLEEEKEREMKLANATDSMDIKLRGQYQASGVDDSHSQAYEKFTDQFKNGYQVGISITIPLGSDLRKSRQSRVLAINNRISAQKDRLQLQIKSEHHKVRKALNLLGKALESQRSIVKNLNKSLKQTKNKYRQARVSLHTLILEQDNLFNSQLQEINTKRQILHLLFDYFKIFPQYPCQINRSLGAQS